MASPVNARRRALVLSEDELADLGLRSFGKNVRIHPTVEFFGAERISIGDNVRIDCFSLISAGEEGIAIGSHIHIGAGCYLFGGGGAILLGDFSGLSPRVSLFTSSDDFTEGYLRGPPVPELFRKVTRGSVRVGRNTVIGASAVVLPGVTLGDNASVGALTVVSSDVPENAIVAFLGRATPLGKRRDGALFHRLMQECYEWWRQSRGPAR